MRHEIAAQQQLEQAENLAEILDAAYGAFEEMLSVIRRYQDSGAPFYAALVMAAAGAADGRNALADAPSLPPAPGQGSREGAPAAAVSPLDTAVCLAELSKTVSSRLRQAGATANGAADQQACEDAARCADEVHALATGHGS